MALQKSRRPFTYHSWQNFIPTNPGPSVFGVSNKESKDSILKLKISSQRTGDNTRTPSRRSTMDDEAAQAWKFYIAHAIFCVKVPLLSAASPQFANSEMHFELESLFYAYPLEICKNWFDYLNGKFSDLMWSWLEV